MKFSHPVVIAASAAISAVRSASAQNLTTCREIIPNDAPDSIGVKVTYVNKMPTAVNTTNPFSYNRMPYENVHGKTIFIDQKGGFIYSHDQASNTVTEIYDMSKDEVPEGVDLFGVYRPYGGFSSGDKPIQAVAEGKKKDEMIVVLTSTTLPPGATTAPLPAEAQWRFWEDPEGACLPENIDATCDGDPADYRTCCLSQKVYKLFYKFKIKENGRIKPDDLFFSHEMQATYGHDGGGFIPTGDGRYLWAVGDCLPYGTNGLYATQDPDNVCGKVILVNPKKPFEYEVAALGVRNNQQMFLDGKIVYWMEVGGVTAEEVNAIPLRKLLDGSQPNFGWGERAGDERGDQTFAREGTFVVASGTPYGGFGIDPPCIDEQTDEELEGFEAPYVQWGNANDDLGFFGISGAVVSKKSFRRIAVATTEFVTGVLTAAEHKYDYKGNMAEKSDETMHVNLYKDDGAGGLTLLTNNFNDLVADVLGVDAGRGDPRMFRFPDGRAGVLIERSGAFYTLEEFDTDGVPTYLCRKKSRTCAQVCRSKKAEKVTNKSACGADDGPDKTCKKNGAKCYVCKCS